MSATQTSTIASLADRYASALFTLAEEAGKEAEVAEEMQALGRLLEDNEPFRKLALNPAIAPQQKDEAVQDLSRAAGLSDLMRWFLGTLAENGRLFALEAICTRFGDLRRKKRGEVAVRVKSAKALTKKQEETLARRLNDALPGTVRMEITVDPDLIGGLVVTVGSRMVDASVKTRLKKLEKEMKETS